MKQKVISRLLVAVWFLAAAVKLSAQGTVISYQGQLSASGVAANTNFDMRFALYTAPTNGVIVSASLTNFSVPVSNGLFSVLLNFGAGAFNGTLNGSNDWLDIGVRLAGTTNFTSLSPRQPILPVPYAQFALSSSNLLGGLQSTQLVGSLASSLVTGTYSNSVTFSNSADVFVGNGSALANLNATSITLGTLADARLSSDVALVDTNQTFTGTNTFTGPGIYTASNSFTGPNNFTNLNNSFTGSFFGNGLVGWVGVPGFTVQAVRDHGYMLTNPALTTVILPSSSSLFPGDIIRVSGASVAGWAVVPNAGQSIVGNFASYRNCVMQTGTTGNGLGTDWRRVVCSSSGSEMFASGNFSQGLAYSTDFGHTWNQTGISGIGWFAVACSASGGIVYAAPTGSAAYVQYSSNGGLSFSPGGITASWNAFACSANGSEYIGTISGNNYPFYWNGTLTAVGQANWGPVVCSGDGNCLAIAAIGGNLAVSLNAGNNWGFVAAPGNCTALAAAATGQKLVAAYIGGIATSTNFGFTWTVTSALSANWSCLAASADCNEIVAGVSNGLFYASSNFGQNWTALTTTNQFWSGACMSADGTKYAGTVATVGSYNGGIYYSSTSSQPNTTVTNNLFGGIGSSVELQYIGNNQFIPASSAGILWGN